VKCPRDQKELLGKSASVFRKGGSELYRYNSLPSAKSRRKMKKRETKY
jgi:hypothetical protein